MHRLSDVEKALDNYNQVAELPKGYGVYVGGNTPDDFQLALFTPQNSLLTYIPGVAPTTADCYLAAVNCHGLQLVRSDAWQHALDNALDEALRHFPKIGSALVTSATGNTSILLYKLPLPSAPKFVAAEITITRGPITLKSHARDVSIGQIVAAICG